MRKRFLNLTTRLAIVLSASFGIATAANWVNYKGYWHGTLRRVQTVDFNLLSHTLPTKLSYALIKGNIDELQRTLDSNYGFFGLVVTDCKTTEVKCPNQQILYSSNSSHKWKQKLNTSILAKASYSTLQDPPPLFVEGKFDTPHDENWKLTGKKNDGTIIGRVYYVRGEPPTFWEDYGNWLKKLPSNALSTSGADKYYVLTVSLFMSAGLATWWLTERILLSKKVKEERLLQAQQQLQDKIQQQTELIANLERDRNRQESIQAQQEKRVQRLEVGISQIEIQREQQKKELQESSGALEQLERALEETKQQHNLTQEQLQEKELEIYLFRQEILIQNNHYQDNIKSLEILQTELEEARKSKEQAQKEAEALQSKLEETKAELDNLSNNKLDEAIRYEDENRVLKSKNQCLEEKNQGLENRVKQLEHNSHQSQFSQSQQTEDKRNFNTVFEVLLAAEQDFGDILRIWNSAKRAAKREKNKQYNFEEIYQAFKAIAEIGKKYFECPTQGISIGKSWKQMFEEKNISKYRPHEYESTKNKYRRDFRHGNQRKQMTEHLTFAGQGNFTLQIYFIEDCEFKKIDIGYCDEHLEYRNQRT